MKTCKYEPMSRVFTPKYLYPPDMHWERSKTWLHIPIVRKSTKIKMYVDGKEVDIPRAHSLFKRLSHLICQELAITVAVGVGLISLAWILL